MKAAHVAVSGAAWQEIRVRSGRKTSPRKSIHTEISPLRFASVEMTKGRGALPEREVAGQKAFFITLGGPQGHEYSVEKHFPQGLKPTVLPPPICTG
jgi:hypothetical protein